MLDFKTDIFTHLHFFQFRMAFIWHTHPKAKKDWEAFFWHCTRSNRDGFVNSELSLCFGNFEKEKWDRKAGRPRPAGDFSPVRGILRPVWYDDGLQIILKLDGTIPHPTDWASFLPIKGTIAIFSLQLSCWKTKGSKTKIQSIKDRVYWSENLN